MLLVVGCRPADSGAFSVQQSQPTPRSTALPALPTLPPPGSSESPIYIALVPANRQAAVDAVEQLRETLADRLELDIRFTLVDRQAEALAALCASPTGTLSAAWIDGLTHAAAEALNCGDAALVGERAVGQVRRTTETVQIVVRAAETIDSLAQLSARNFCRLNVQDINSWLLPSLLLRANGIDPIGDLGRIRDYDDNEALIEGLIDRECDAAGITESDLASLSAEANEAVRSIASIEVPFGVLLYPQEIGLGLREQINAALQGISAAEQFADAMRAVFGQDGLRIPVADDFEPLADLIERTDLDLAALGSP